MNLVDCGAPGAYGVPDGLSYVLDRDRSCRRAVRGLRRSAKTVRSLPPGDAKVQAGLAFARRVQKFGRRHPIEAAVPPPAADLERRAFRAVRQMARHFMDMLHAARRFDESAFDRAQRRFRRSGIRGSAAWSVLNIPGCVALYRLRLD